MTQKRTGAGPAPCRPAAAAAPISEFLRSGAPRIPRDGHHLHIKHQGGLWGDGPHPRLPIRQRVGDGEGALLPGAHALQALLPACGEGGARGRTGERRRQYEKGKQRGGRGGEGGRKEEWGGEGRDKGQREEATWPVSNPASTGGGGGKGGWDGHLAGHRTGAESRHRHPEHKRPYQPCQHWPVDGGTQREALFASAAPAQPPTEVMARGSAGSPRRLPCPRSPHNVGAAPAESSVAVAPPPCVYSIPLAPSPSPAEWAKNIPGMTMPAPRVRSKGEPRS